jgi:hypothetical protein
MITFSMPIAAFMILFIVAAIALCVLMALILEVK